MTNNDNNAMFWDITLNRPFSGFGPFIVIKTYTHRCCIQPVYYKYSKIKTSFLVCYVNKNSNISWIVNFPILLSMYILKFGGVMPKSPWGGFTSSFFNGLCHAWTIFEQLMTKENCDLTTLMCIKIPYCGFLFYIHWQGKGGKV